MLELQCRLVGKGRVIGVAGARRYACVQPLQCPPAAVIFSRGTHSTMSASTCQLKCAIDAGVRSVRWVRIGGATSREYATAAGGVRRGRQPACEARCGSCGACRMGVEMMHVGAALNPVF